MSFDPIDNAMEVEFERKSKKLDDEIANADPMDYYDEFNEWIMKNCYPIANGDDLLRNFEDGNKFEEFLRSRK